MKVLATNRELGFKYIVLEEIECGIELKGNEVKAIKDGKVNLKDSFALIKNYEVYLKNAYVSPLENGNAFLSSPTRDRKLLLHKEEIIKLSNKIKQDGLTLVPKNMVLAGNKVKINLALCKGKKLWDKRDSEKEKESKREINSFK